MQPAEERRKRRSCSLLPHPTYVSLSVSKALLSQDWTLKRSPKDWFINCSKGPIKYWSNSVSGILKSCWNGVRTTSKISSPKVNQKASRNASKLSEYTIKDVHFFLATLFYLLDFIINKPGLHCKKSLVCVLYTGSITLPNRKLVDSHDKILVYSHAVHTSYTLQSQTLHLVWVFFLIFVPLLFM